ncbi:Diacylglycerol O-acyltransferase 1 [Collichthys lucidus]|uniref:diacylglycerol O-acyltransferase n=1 Tax=Collichthys lucidus TaxID=240159 RepID=A0A4U5UGT4_COLLU|nr:Diacylglycerol O-acyltransferase 1 [Collichthys lucidus]
MYGVYLVAPPFIDVLAPTPDISPLLTDVFLSGTSSFPVAALLLLESLLPEFLRGAAALRRSALLRRLVERDDSDRFLEELEYSLSEVVSQLVENNVPPSQAELLVFLMSAALCECMIALPLHSCRLWIFFMMVAELLVAVFLGNHFEGNYGNGLVWLCLLLGPPLAVTTYFHDHYISSPHHHHHHHHPHH